MRSIILALTLFGCGTTTFWGPVDYIDSHGIEIVEANFPVNRWTQESMIEAELVLWETRMPMESFDCPRSMASDWILVWRSFPFRDEFYYQGTVDLAGLTIVRLKTMLVGFRNPLESTALLHELDHVVAGYCLGDWTYGD